MERIVLNVIRKSDVPFIKNATTIMTEFPPFLPSMNVKENFVKFVSDDGLLQNQRTAEDGYKNPFETLKTIMKKYGDQIGAHTLKLNLVATIVKKEEVELEYNDDYVAKEAVEASEEEKEDKHDCPECKLIIDKINAGSKIIGNINLRNTAIETPYAVLETSNSLTESITLEMDNYNFNVHSSFNLFDTTYKIIMLKVVSISADTNAVYNTIESIRDMLLNNASDKYVHYLLEYSAEAVLEKVEMSAYIINSAELRTLIDGELRIAPIHNDGKHILWIPIRYTKQPYLNNIKGQGRFDDIATNYIDTVIGHVRIKKRDIVNNNDYIEHHNELKWLESVGFGDKELLLYIK